MILRPQCHELGVFHLPEHQLRLYRSRVPLPEDVLLCMLAYYVEWHMRQAWAPILFDDDDPAAGEALRGSPVAPGKRSPRAEGKAAGKRTER